jgi:predicted transposase/invertase (TIGR01784 family)
VAKEEGIEKGVEKGVEKGRSEERAENARRMKVKGLSSEEIAVYGGVSEAEVESL